ncbi:MAG: hypothetical protein EBY21_10705 [Alphaproteobacteria bacterium]|nr:hypothetical protein [Alphaproteobacteria bacterium]
MGLGFGVCLAFVLHGQAQAQTPLQQCSAQYQAAKTANQLNGLSWNQFRAQCTSSQVAQANPLKPAAADTPPPPATAKPASKSSAATGEAKAASQGTAPVSNAVFPKAINPKYVNEKPGQQRSKTCLDQYNANKATNSNGGMKWIEKGGGYYSQCTNRLKA